MCPPSVFVKLKTDQKQNLLYFTIARDVEEKVMKICANILLKKTLALGVQRRNFALQMALEKGRKESEWAAQ